MPVLGPYNPVDLDVPVLCPGCGWRGKIKATVFVPEGPAECPECGKPVEVDEC